MKDIAMVLVVVGIMMMAITGMNNAAEQPQLNEAGLQVQVKENRSMKWSPYVGGLFLTVAVVLLISGKRR